MPTCKGCGRVTSSSVNETAVGTWNPCRSVSAFAVCANLVNIRIGTGVNLREDIDIDNMALEGFKWYDRVRDFLARSNHVRWHYERSNSLRRLWISRRQGRKSAWMQHGRVGRFILNSIVRHRHLTKFREIARKGECEKVCLGALQNEVGHHINSEFFTKKTFWQEREGC